MTCCLLSAAPWKQLWIDEFLHFAFGAYDSAGEAWRVFRMSLHLINHNQTGAYIMADYALLRIFGASALWLRLPSLLSGVLLFAAAMHLLEQWRLPAVWRLGGALALFTQPVLMDFVSEARPYLPLAAAVVATLAYYSSDGAVRRRWDGRLLGVLGILGGALVHPYFSVYWLFAGVFTFVHAAAEGRLRPTFRAFVVHCDPWLSVIGVTVYFGLAWATWLNRGPLFHLDPYQWIGAAPGAVRECFLQSHFGFLTRYRPVVLALALFGAGWSLTPAGRGMRSAVIGALALLVAGCLLSAWVSLQAAGLNYWILPRQWVASIALMPLAATWLAWSVSRAGGRRMALVVAAVCVGFVGRQAIRAARNDLRRYAVWIREPAAPAPPSAAPAHGPRPTTNDGWVALANANCAAGGRVWPVFREFYPLEVPAKRAELFPTPPAAHPPGK